MSPVSARVGMVGGGQLARMTHQAAIALGVDLVVLAAGEDEAAALSVGSVQLGDPADLDALRGLAADCDVVTFDHELVPNDHIRALEEEGVVVRPGASAKLAGQDKRYARELLSSAGLPVPRFAVVERPEDAAAMAAEVGWPLVLKARRGGYDGRGVLVADGPDDVGEALAGGGEWLAEAHVDIERELAQIVVRSPSGESVAYPLIETVQSDGICVEAMTPAGVGEGEAEACARMATEIAELTGAVGVLAVEIFLAESGELLINELALRPHNSGHLTIEACETSQFENHLRAVLDWPLGSPALRAAAAVMTNVLGSDGGDPAHHVAGALAVPGAHPHLYGKRPGPGRKLGHVTAVGSDLAVARDASHRSAAILSEGPTG